MIQLSAVNAGAMAIIALLIAYAATGDAKPKAATGGRVGGPALTASDRAVAGGRAFVFRDGAWWQEDLPPGLLPRSISSPTVPAPEALARAPWIASLLRRGPVVFELDGAVQVVDLAAAAPAVQTRAGEIATTR